MAKEFFFTEGQAYWAFTSKRNNMSDKYQLDLGQLSKKAITLFESHDIEVKTEDRSKVEAGSSNDRGKYVTIKADFIPAVADVGLRVLPPEVLIGNGSRVKVKWNPYDWTFKKKSGTSAGLRAVMVIDLVEYEMGSALEGFEEEEEGFRYSDPEEVENGTAADFQDFEAEADGIED